MKTVGLRNNNPGNIRFNAANDWVGQIGQDKRGYVIFDKPENGIRAMGKVLDSYARQGIVKLTQIISRWAPDNENDTASYLAHVASQTGWDPGFIPVRSEGDYHALVKAIIKHENGFIPPSYDDQFITNALGLA